VLTADYTAALVIATLMLAAVTILVVFATLRLAKRTIEATDLADRHHQESLAPLLVIRNLDVVADAPDTQTLEYIADGYPFTIRGEIVNIGGGSATDISLSFIYDRFAMRDSIRFNIALADHDQEPLNFRVRVPDLSDDALGAISHNRSAAIRVHRYEVVITYHSMFGTCRATSYIKPAGGDVSETITPVLLANRLRPKARRWWEWWELPR
jgi:hypothetical protein